MRRIAQIFDYFKLAYGLNQKNKTLYVPQMILVGIKTLIYMLMVFMTYRLVTHFSLSEMYLTAGNTFNYIFYTMRGFLGLVIVLAIAEWLFSAGLYNMYRKALEKQALTQAVFMEGIRKYALPFLAVNILMLIFWLIIAIPYLIIGVITLFIGFALIPILISILTVMWKVSIVIDGKGIFEGLSRSIDFAKKNFIPLGALMIVQNAFLAARTGGSSNPGINMNFNNTSNFNRGEIGNMPQYFSGRPWIGNEVEKVMDFISRIMIVLIPVVGIATFVGGFVSMIIEIFFKLSFFVMYAENRSVDEPAYDEQEQVVFQREVL